MTHSHPAPDRRHVLLGSLSLLTLAGCGHLLGPENAPGQIYMLAPELPTSPPKNVAWQLAVAVPQASASLSTDRIALERGGMLDYYADAQWSDAVPQLLQTKIIDALEKGGALNAVARDVVGIRTDYLLVGEVGAFEARYDHGDAPPVATVDITLKLMASRSGAIVDAREFRREAQASINGIPAVVAAFDQCLSAVLADVTRWTIDAAASHEAEAKRAQ